MSDLVYKEAQDAQRKFFYGLVSIALGALALSIQFSPKMGQDLWWLLLIAWSLLFISSVAGGWRLSIETTVLRNMYYKLTADDEAGVVAASELITKQHKPTKWLTKAQIWSLIGGLLSNLIFAAVNYVCQN